MPRSHGAGARAVLPRASSPAQRGRGTAAGGGGGCRRFHPGRLAPAAALDPSKIETAAAPSTVLRLVPLPRCAGEDVRGTISAQQGLL